MTEGQIQTPGFCSMDQWSLSKQTYFESSAWRWSDHFRTNEDNSNQIICAEGAVYARKHSCPHLWLHTGKDQCCHGITHANCHRYLYFGKLLPKSLTDQVERRSHKTAGQLLTACLILFTPLQSWWLSSFETPQCQRKCPAEHLQWQGV